MGKTLTSCEIVLVVQGINVKLLSQEWLIEKGIFSQDELLFPAPIFTGSFISASCPECELVITDARIQLKMSGLDGHKKGIEKIRRVLAAFQDCPYTAAGINFEWTVSPLKDIHKATVKNFLPASAKTAWAKEFGSDSSAIIGANFYRKFQESFMTLKIHPDVSKVIANSDEKNPCGMLLNFNFHLKVEKSPKKTIEAYLKTWKAKYEESVRLAGLFSE